MHLYGLTQPDVGIRRGYDLMRVLAKRISDHTHARALPASELLRESPRMGSVSGYLGPFRRSLTISLMLGMVCAAGVKNTLGDSAAYVSPSRRARSAYYDAIQEDMALCGPNCLYIAMRLHGRPVSYQDVLDRAASSRGPNSRGTSLSELVQGAQSLGVPCAARKYSRVRDLERCDMPLIAHYKEGHYVVVLGVTGLLQTC